MQARGYDPDVAAVDEKDPHLGPDGTAVELSDLAWVATYSNGTAVAKAFNFGTPTLSWSCNGGGTLAVGEARGPGKI